MSDYAESLFADLVDEATPPEPEGAKPPPDPEFYPGSRHKIPPKPKAKKIEQVSDKPWDRNPRLLKVNGVEMEFFTIGALAEAINRRPVTIRSWETKGVIPKARYRTPSVGDQPGRRLYTRHQVEGMVRLCAKYEILSFGARPDAIPVGFTDEVIDLWMEA